VSRVNRTRRRPGNKRIRVKGGYPDPLCYIF
jgi:hypothetical protein